MGVILICFDTSIIAIKKVTKLRVRISKSTIKSIFMVFPSGLRRVYLKPEGKPMKIDFIVVLEILTLSLVTFLIAIIEVSKHIKITPTAKMHWLSC